MKTILTDNDIVFIDAPKLHAITGATIYYTDAYAGWQKGNVENCNKIIRRRHDKGTDFSKMSKREERHPSHRHQKESHHNGLILRLKTCAKTLAFSTLSIQTSNQTSIWHFCGECGRVCL